MSKPTPFLKLSAKPLIATNPDHAFSMNSAELHRAAADAVNRRPLDDTLAEVASEISRASQVGAYSTALNVPGAGFAAKHENTHGDFLIETLCARLTRAGYSARIQGRLLIISWA